LLWRTCSRVTNTPSTAVSSRQQCSRSAVLRGLRYVTACDTACQMDAAVFIPATQSGGGSQRLVVYRRAHARLHGWPALLLAVYSAYPVVSNSALSCWLLNCVGLDCTCPVAGMPASLAGWWSHMGLDRLHRLSLAPIAFRKAVRKVLSFSFQPVKQIFNRPADLATSAGLGQ
jgi:hypothetical protein